MKQLILIFGLLIPLFMTAQGQSEAPSSSELSRHPIKQVRVNDLEYHYIEAGTGETIFFLHGFPDLAGTWDETIDSMSQEYRCIAPFLRGYYPTDMAADGDYHPVTIARDIDAMAQKLGIDRYYVVGQDWGASVTYSIVSQFPEKVIKATTIAIPHSSAIKLRPRLIYRARHFVKFRNEEKSVRYTRKDNFKYLDVLYKRWSPGWEEYTATAELIKKTFRLEGRLEAALGYYWSLAKGGDEEDAILNKVPEVPLLAIAGADDGALTMTTFRRMEKKMPDNVRILVNEDAGHFLHQEVPQWFIKNLREFLKE